MTKTRSWWAFAVLAAASLAGSWAGAQSVNEALKGPIKDPEKYCASFATMAKAMKASGHALLSRADADMADDCRAILLPGADTAACRAEKLSEVACFKRRLAARPPRTVLAANLWAAEGRNAALAAGSRRKPLGPGGHFDSLTDLADASLSALDAIDAKKFYLTQYAPASAADAADLAKLKADELHSLQGLRIGSAKAVRDILAMAIPKVPVCVGPCTEALKRQRVRALAALKGRLDKLPPPETSL